MDPDKRPATKSDLGELETRLGGRVADLETHMKADMADLETRMTAHLEGRMDAQEQRIIERMTGMIQDTETRLLQAFYGIRSERLSMARGISPFLAK